MLNISQKIKKLEKDESFFHETIEKVREADLVIWSFGLWVLAVPAPYEAVSKILNELRMKWKEYWILLRSNQRYLITYSEKP